MMITRRALATAGCSHCRASILRLFVTPTATPSPLVATRVSTAWRTVAITGQTARAYSSTPSPLEPIDANSLEELSQGQDSNHDHHPEGDATPTSSVPWYLQMEPPLHTTSAEPPLLPEIPPNSPAIIEVLLNYASEEMGLDDLSLLDLRELNPPPAFGPNLFMLFGTARGERHLNVSAGRLVRWLRAKHRIYADADGLLGPNERKTKLKRKAKRARLLGTMGTDDADDGIATGWICVNLGTINRSSTQTAVVGQDGRSAGFGVPQTGSTVVVQIMTESRRAELGLETLWERSLTRQSSTAEQTENSTSTVVLRTEKGTLSKTPSRPTAAAPPSSHQASFFSTLGGRTLY